MPSYTTFQNNQKTNNFKDIRRLIDSLGLLAAFPPTMETLAILPLLKNLQKSKCFPQFSAIGATAHGVREQRGPEMA